MPVQMIPQKRRLACDRCHSQKLRCLKRQENESCARCFRAGASCNYSPSIRSQRAQPVGPELGPTPGLDGLLMG